MPVEWVKCDAACPARASTMVDTGVGVLYFCTHHFRRWVVAFITRDFTWNYLTETQGTVTVE